MQEQPRNRDWVKNAAIIFLVVILVLTFFSNTIMNRTLPEVATQEVTSGSIVARVRGTGTVQANSNTQVKMDRNRVIRSVLVKVGQQVNAGDVLFTLGEGASEDIDAAEEKVQSLQASYNKMAATMPEFNYSTDTRKIGILADKLAEAQSALEKAEAKKNASLNEQSLKNLKIIQSELARATEARKEAERKYNDDIAQLEELKGWKNKQDSIVPEMVEHELLDGDLISNSSGYSDRSRIETQITRVKTQVADTTYTIVFYNEDETALYSSVIGENVVPTYPYYKFLGWFDPEGKPIAPATKDTTYTAKYSDTPVTTYNIIFYNDDGAALQSSVLSYNDVPTYNSGTPTSSKDTATETYRFLGWVDPDGNPIAPATKDTTYTAKYSDTPVTTTTTTTTYTILFYNDDGTALESLTLNPNDVPVYSYGTPTSSKDTDTETYRFVKWVDPDGNPIAPATKDTTYTATYSDTPVTKTSDIIINTGSIVVNTDTPVTTTTYTIVFYNDDGTALETLTLAPNDVPVYSYGTPTSSKDTATETYQFLRWVDPDGNPIAPATKDTTYTAQYSDTPETNASPDNNGLLGANMDSFADNMLDSQDSSGSQDDIGALNTQSLEEELNLEEEPENLDEFNSLLASYITEGLEQEIVEKKSEVIDANLNSETGSQTVSGENEGLEDELYEIKAQEESSPKTDAYYFDLDTQYNETKLYSIHSDWEKNPNEWLTCLEYCLKVYNECENKIFVLQTSSVEEYEAALEAEIKWSDLYDKYMETITPEGANAKARYEAWRTAKDNYDTAVEAYHDKKSNNETTLAGYNADLANLWQQITKAKEKLADLLGGEEAQITAKVSGTIQTLSAAPGDTKKKDDVLATIEVPDMGYMMSFSVTNDQASRLRVGDTGTVSNFYWGDEITATLKSIGQKSANYDVIIPSSSVRTDANGTYVLKMESKNSPLGNRYLARRVPVEVLAVDDTNSAVSADLGYGDYVITSSSAPLKNGQMVRLATSS